MCKGGESPPFYFMDEEEIYLKTCDFYIAESKKMLAKSKNAKTLEEKEKAIKDLIALRSKIRYEIKQIDDFMDRGY